MLTPTARLSVLALVIAGICGLSSVARAGIRVTEKRLTVDNSSDFDPAISGSNTVFTSNRAGSLDIFLVDQFWDISPVATGAGEQRNADTDAANVVYVDTRLSDTNIALRDLTSGSSKLLTTDLGPDYSPAISGNNVVFVSRRVGTDDIFLVDPATFDITPVAIGPGAEIAPAIDGNLVAWQVFESGSINVYAQELGSPTFAVATSLADESGASVSGDLIAYITDGDVAVYDHSTGQTTRITNDSFQQKSVLVDGQRLVWTDDRNGNDDLFLYTLCDGQLYQLTTDPSDQTLGDFEGNRVVFHDNRGGDFDVWQVEFTIVPEFPLLFSRGADPNGLYALDPTTGSATHVGATGVLAPQVGLSPAAAQDTLFASLPFGIREIVLGGSATALGPAVAEALAYDPTTDTLYGASNLSGPALFFTIDTATGSLDTPLASPGVDLEGLAYAPGLVFGLAGAGTCQGCLFAYDIDANSWNVIGYTGITFDDPGLAYAPVGCDPDPFSGVLYAIGSQDTNLYSIDPVTAIAAVVGDTGLPFGTTWGGLAYLPEPHGLLQWVAGLLLLSVLRWRRWTRRTPWTPLPH